MSYSHILVQKRLRLTTLTINLYLALLSCHYISNKENYIAQVTYAQQTINPTPSHKFRGSRTIYEGGEAKPNMTREGVVIYEHLRNA